MITRDPEGRAPEIWHLGFFNMHGPLAFCCHRNVAAVWPRFDPATFRSALEHHNHYSTEAGLHTFLEPRKKVYHFAFNACNLVNKKFAMHTAKLYMTGVVALVECDIHTSVSLLLSTPVYWLL